MSRSSFASQRVASAPNAADPLEFLARMLTHLRTRVAAEARRGVAGLAVAVVAQERGVSYVALG
jgi:hypothetical protein